MAPLVLNACVVDIPSPVEFTTSYADGFTIVYSFSSVSAAAFIVTSHADAITSLADDKKKLVIT